MEKLGYTFLMRGRKLYCEIASKMSAIITVDLVFRALCTCFNIRRGSILDRRKTYQIAQIAQIMFENWVSVTYWLVTVNVLTGDYVENAAICPPFAC